VTIISSFQQQIECALNEIAETVNSAQMDETTRAEINILLQAAAPEQIAKSPTSFGKFLSTLRDKLISSGAVAVAAVAATQLDPIIKHIGVGFGG